MSAPSIRLADDDLRAMSARLDKQWAEMVALCTETAALAEKAIEQRDSLRVGGVAFGRVIHGFVPRHG